MITANQLREQMHYDPLTGAFTWRLSKSGHVRAGDKAGCVDARGYIRIGLCGAQYLAHRLAWLYVHSTWPADDIDHRDLNTSNNAIANLRPASPSQNQANRGPQRNNLSGLKGVSWRDGKWIARLRKDRRQLYLGRFNTPEEAHAVYTKAAEEHFGSFARVA